MRHGVLQPPTEKEARETRASMELSSSIILLVFIANVAFSFHFLYLLAVSLAAHTRRRKPVAEGVARSRFKIVIPAHDEELGITDTVRSCQAQDYPKDLFELIVIADNCLDSTAALAGRAGATVIERHDDLNRSKGHALRFLFDRLEKSGEMDRTDSLVIIDSDTVVDAALLRGFASRLEEGHDWIQAYDTVSNPDASWRTRQLAYSFSLINGVRLLGQNALGLSASLCGNGMCMSIRGLRRRPWQTYGLVEDLEYSWQLRVQGEMIVFAPEVACYAAMPTHCGSAASNQRRRWEFGRKVVKRQMLGPLLRTRQLGLLKKLASILELTMPTTVFLVNLFLGLAVVNLLISSLARSELVLIRTLPYFTCFQALCLVVYGISPFFLFPISWRVLASLVYFPYYTSWKVLTWFRGSPQKWVRTERQEQTTH
jgi:cellulose synthase/poly-beta-1,6-N-acetylglucosamine synthase-like glycosyltransferase